MAEVLVVLPFYDYETFNEPSENDRQEAAYVAAHRPD